MARSSGECRSASIGQVDHPQASTHPEPAKLLTEPLSIDQTSAASHTANEAWTAHLHTVRTTATARFLDLRAAEARHFEELAEIKEGTRNKIEAAHNRHLAAERRTFFTQSQITGFKAIIKYHESELVEHAKCAFCLLSFNSFFSSVFPVFLTPTQTLKEDRCVACATVLIFSTIKKKELNVTAAPKFKTFMILFLLKSLKS